MRQAADFWNDAAERYARRPIADMAAYEDTLARARRHLRASDHALELGCGTGTTALLLAGSVARYTATDLSPAMIAIGRRKAAAEGAATLRFAVAPVGGGADDDAFASGAQDVVLAFNLLHLVPDLAATLAEVARLLKPGGTFISKTPCRPSAGFGPRLKFALIRAVVPAMQLIGKAPPVTFFTATELEERMQEAGFRMVETKSYGTTLESRFLVALKA